MKLTNPRPSPPYRGISLFMLEEAIRGLKEPSWKSNCPRLFAPATSTTPTPIIASLRRTAAQAAQAAAPSAAPTPAQAPVQAAQAAPLRPLFGGPLGGRPSAQTTNTTFVFHSAPAAPINPVAIPSSSSPAELPKPASTPSILPACNLAAKTKPIIDELLAGINGLQLEDFVKLELKNT